MEHIGGLVVMMHIIHWKSLVKMDILMDVAVCPVQLLPVTFIVRHNHSLILGVSCVSLQAMMSKKVSGCVF